MIDFLAPFFAGPLRPYAERLALAGAAGSEPFGVMARGASLDAGWAAECLARASRASDCEDLRALAAAWFRDYTMAVLPGALVAATLHRRGLTFDADAVVWCGAANGWLAMLVLPDGGEASGATLAALLSPLVNAHLPRVVAAFSVAARVSQRLLWCTGGVATAGIARQLAAHPVLTPAQRAEVLAWIDAPVSIDGFANPFHGAFRPGAEPGQPCVAPVRRICCLNYRLPGEGHCGTCPRTVPTPSRTPSARANVAIASTP